MILLSFPGSIFALVFSKLQLENIANGICWKANQEVKNNLFQTSDLSLAHPENIIKPGVLRCLKEGKKGTIAWFFLSLTLENKERFHSKQAFKILPVATPEWLLLLSNQMGALRVLVNDGTHLVGAVIPLQRKMITLTLTKCQPNAKQCIGQLGRQTKNRRRYYFSGKFSNF